MLKYLFALLLGSFPLISCYAQNGSTTMFSGYIDYLYWRADRLEQYMPVQNDFISYFSPEYSSGFRTGVEVERCQWNGEARYTYFNSNDIQKKRGTNDFLYTLQYHLNYQIVDLNFGYDWCFSCPQLKIKPYVGAKFAWLKETTDLVQSVTSKTKKYDSCAYGPSLGINGNWQLCHWFFPISLIARGEIALLSIRSKFSEPFLVTSDPVNNPLERRDPAYYFTSLQTLYIGLGFGLCPLSCLKGELAIGYEIQNWTSLYTYVGVGHEQGQLDSLGVGGLDVRFSIQF